MAIIGTKLYYLDEVDSTNDYAKTLIKDSPEGTVILADTQISGRARFNNKWFSPEGGLWLSIILHPLDHSLISIIAGIAVCKTLHMNGVLTGIKWPNDIILNNRKIGGILTELVDHTVILGIGINLNIRKFPAELKDTASSVFLETKKHLENKMIFDILCRQLDDCYGLLKEKQTRQLLDEWRRYTILLGQRVVVEMPDKTVNGKVLDISDKGELIILDRDGKIQRIIAGICHLRKDTG
jgi:BirA family biotin operon repressor/biotin-[acetyl-CoA-carboxylase] ligase